MYKLLFETDCKGKDVKSVNEALFEATGEKDWGYDTQEVVDKSIREGFLEFENGKMRVYADGI